MLMPSMTGLISDVLSDEPTYRLLSAMTHGHHWALLQLGYTQDEADDGTSDYGKIRQHISAPSIGYLVRHALKAYLRPVWYRSHLNGWDLKYLRDILDSAYDSMQFNETDRIWRAHGVADAPTDEDSRGNGAEEGGKQDEERNSHTGQPEPRELCGTWMASAREFLITGMGMMFAGR